MKDLLFLISLDQLNKLYEEDELNIETDENDFDELDIETFEVPQSAILSSKTPTAKKNTIPADIVDLIETLIGDGELEQEEIDYLKEKSAEYGVSPIEVVSLAKTMLKKQQDEKVTEELNYQRQIEAEERKHQRKENFEGEVKKCPHCGEVINALSKTCAACGKLISVDEIRNLMSSFEYSLSNAEGYMDNKKSHINSFNECIGTARKYLRQLKASYGSREDVKSWLIESEKEIKRVQKSHLRSKKIQRCILLPLLIIVVFSCISAFNYFGDESGLGFGLAIAGFGIFFGFMSTFPTER